MVRFTPNYNWHASLLNTNLFIQIQFIERWSNYQIVFCKIPCNTNFTFKIFTILCKLRRLIPFFLINLIWENTYSYLDILVVLIHTQKGITCSQLSGQYCLTSLEQPTWGWLDHQIVFGWGSWHGLSHLYDCMLTSAPSGIFYKNCQLITDLNVY